MLREPSAGPGFALLPAIPTVTEFQTHEQRKSFYLTTPIYYVNSVPHLGTAYTTIAADALARYRRMCGDDVCFLTGLDEHGQKVEQAADRERRHAAGVGRLASPPKFHEAWEMLDISNDDFIRTTEPRHEAGRPGASARRSTSAATSTQGTTRAGTACPSETYCTEEQLAEDHTCPQCGRDVEFVREDNYFFKLSAYQDRLLALYEANPHFIQPETRRNEVAVLREGRPARPLDLAREREVGHPAAVRRGPHHLRVVRRAHQLHHRRRLRRPRPRPSEFEKRWPAQFHFVGKDIIRFHCVIWPAMLMAAGLPVPERVFAHGFLLTKGEKMSKSKGNAMAPADLVGEFGVDAYRYYFLRDVQFGTDGSISLEAMVQRYNGDLANDWGNLCSRLFNMVGKYCDGAVPAAVRRARPPTTPSSSRIAEAPARGATRRAMDVLDYAGALEAAWELIKRTNRYIEDSAPWNLAKSEETLPRLARRALQRARGRPHRRAVHRAGDARAPRPRSGRAWGSATPSPSPTSPPRRRGAGLPVGNAVVKGDALFPRIVEDAE